MLKKLIRNTMWKKSIIFTLVFALTGVLLSNSLVDVSNTWFVQQVYAASAEQEFLRFYEEDPPAPTATWASQEEGDSNFAKMVRAANQEDTGRPIFREEEETASSKNSGFAYLQAIPLSEDLQRFTFELCQETGVEYELALAVMWRESRFQVNAVGYNTNGTKDSGVMQINDVNRGWLQKRYGITDLMDPYQNIKAGVYMLAEYMNDYNNEGHALMAYQYGEAGMLKKVSQGIHTNKQIDIALGKRDMFKKMIASA